MKNMKLYILGLLTLLFGMMTGACSDDVKEHFAEGQRMVQTRLAGYVVGGNDATLSEENVITDVKACLFEDGVLVKVYDRMNGSPSLFRCRATRLPCSLPEVWCWKSNLPMLRLK